MIDDCCWLMADGWLLMAVGCWWLLVAGSIAVVNPKGLEDVVCADSDPELNFDRFRLRLLLIFWFVWFRKVLLRFRVSECFLNRLCKKFQICGCNIFAWSFARPRYLRVEWRCDTDTDTRLRSLGSQPSSLSVSVGRQKSCSRRRSHTQIRRHTTHTTHTRSHPESNIVVTESQRAGTAGEASHTGAACDSFLFCFSHSQRQATALVWVLQPLSHTQRRSAQVWERTSGLFVVFRLS